MHKTLRTRKTCATVHWPSALSANTGRSITGRGLTEVSWDNSSPWSDRTVLVCGCFWFGAFKVLWRSIMTFLAFQRRDTNYSSFLIWYCCPSLMQNSVPQTLSPKSLSEAWRIRAAGSSWGFSCILNSIDPNPRVPLWMPRVLELDFFFHLITTTWT